MAFIRNFGITTTKTVETTFKKIDAAIPVAGKAIYFAIAGARAKMLGKTYQDVLSFLQYEYTLPENEETWKKRQDLLIELSEIFEKRKENTALPNDLVQKVKSVLPHIVTTAGSERTTLSGAACRALSSIVKNLDAHLQPHLDILLPGLIAVCGSTKAVNQKNANDVITSICKHAGYSPRLFYHVCAAFKDIRVPPRTYAPEWLNILLRTYRTQMDRDRDGGLAGTAIFQGLTDGQVKVRENSRAVFWTYHKYDVAGARMIMGGLNTHAQKALQADPRNPDKPATAKPAAAPRPKSALASIKAQNKERLAKSQDSNDPHKPHNPVDELSSVKTAFFGSMEVDDGKKPSLLSSAPVRRRIVATPMASSTATQRPDSRGRATPAAPTVAKDILKDTMNEKVTKATTESVAAPSWETTKSEPKSHKLVPDTLSGTSWETLKSEGKENAMVIRQKKKRSPQRSPEHERLASEKKALATAIESLRRKGLDALGWRRLKKLLEENPAVLITKQVQYDELFELLVTNIANLDLITESREKRLTNYNHPAYHTHTMLVCLMHLQDQYPQWPEPQPGMTLSALLIARCNFSSSYESVLAAVDDGALYLCDRCPTILPTIDAVLDTLQTVERIITSNDPIVTPKSTDTIFFNSLQSLGSDFGPDKPRFANRLPIVMDFGLKIINQLLYRLEQTGESLYEIQEDRLSGYASYLLATYNSIIKRGVMNFCVSLHAVVKPEKRFYNYFKKEADKNLIHYYVDIAGSP
ncbi:suppressor of tub2 mutation [Cladophialophora chaetospira]|uniref:Suppressor of tub2 mutation n=1 Tax=Cladophialophora chaetospira TaxID=386627 RepID=A0AA38XK16_9EURO|nr:suppressor of tub2 mutation [Cladophialophora chaetospira]